MISKHFAVGEFIQMNNQRAEVIVRPGDGFMIVSWESDGTVEILRPMCLSWERK